MKRLIFLILLVGCQATPDTDLASNEQIDKTTAPLKAFCFYKMDDKYCEISDNLQIEIWMEEKSIALTHNDVRGNLFEHKGSGPNGAEWNPSTDIYVVINRIGAGIDVLQNDVNYKYVAETVGDYTWIKITKSEMDERLIDLTDQAWDEMFPNGALVEEDIYGLEGAIQPPKTGKVIKFNVTQDSTTLTHYFYAAFGE